jgi:CRP-like cAMP-binding protein
VGGTTFIAAGCPATVQALGAVLSVRLDPDLAEALSREAARRSRISGTTIGHTTLARQLIADGLRPPAQRVSIELEVGQDGSVRALPVTPHDRDVA